MTIKQIEKLLSPKSIAVIGASNKRNRPGHAVMRNLLDGGFSGPIMPVNPKYSAINGVLAYETIAELPIAPDLAIICTRVNRVANIIRELSAKGTKNAIVIAAGFEESHDDDKSSLQQAMNLASQEYGMRILGPHSLGFIHPRIGLNASYAHTSALPGKIAFISQSAAIGTTILDWARYRGIGFSHFISLGESGDIDFDELIDFLGRDPRTQAILIYVDNLTEGRNFLSASRAASQLKPIVVIKGGRTQTGTNFVTQSSDNPYCIDSVYDAAFRRAGMLRVNDFHELFAAVETLAHAQPIRADKLTILTNGIGPCALAIDTLIEKGGQLAQLSEETVAELKAVVPNGGTFSNPVNLLGDASPDLYQQVIEILIKAPEVQNLMIMHSPSALHLSEVYAKQVIARIKEIDPERRTNILVTWAGEETASKARKLFGKAGIPSFRTPEGSVGAFMHMVEYRRNQKQLAETPESINTNISYHPELARTVVTQALQKGQETLDSIRSTSILKACGIHAVSTQVAETPSEARSRANDMEFPVALKIESSDIPYKSDIGGVVLNLYNPEEVEHAAQAMLSKANEVFPNAAIKGFTLQTMARRAGAHRVRIRVKDNPVFGPAIFLGEGGKSWNLEKNTVVALPPLNMALSQYLLDQAINRGVLHDQASNNRINRSALCLLLTQVSQLIVDNPEISELDIDPVFLTRTQAEVLNCHIKLDRRRHPLSIRPYPKETEEHFKLKNGRAVLLRPIRPEDETTHQKFDRTLSKEDRYRRYFGEVPMFTHEQMALLTQIDYDREMAFIASDESNPKQAETLGVVRAKIDPGKVKAEFAIVIHSTIKGEGLGRKLMQKIISYCKDHGVKKLEGYTMTENTGMTALARSLGFNVRYDSDEGAMYMILNLQ